MNELLLGGAPVQIDADNNDPQTISGLLEILGGTGISTSISKVGTTTTITIENTDIYTDENAQDAVGGILTDSVDIDFTYDDVAPSITAILTTTGVLAGTYGSSNEVGVFTVDSKGRITSASEVSISISASQVSDFSEAVDDRVATLLVAGSNITLTYNDVANTLTIASSGGSGSPGGSNKQVQFNDSGAFGGDANFTWDKTANELDVNNLNFKGNTISATNTGGNILIKADSSSGRTSIGFTGGGYSSVSNPVLIFNEDASAGFYRPASGETGLSDDNSKSAWFVDTNEMVINDDGADRNFRIESTVSDNNVFLDGATGNIGIYASNPAGIFHVQPTGSNPVMASSGDTVLAIFQNSGSAASRASIFIISDDTGVSTIWAGDEANAEAGALSFDNNNDVWITLAEAAVCAPKRTESQRDAVSSPTEGMQVYVTDIDNVSYYDGQRWKYHDAGWCPYAYPINFVATSAFTTALTLAANGGSIAIPIVVPTHMILESVSVRNTDTGTQRTWDWDLYQQRLNNGNSGENTLDRKVASSGAETFTPAGAASTRTITASADTYLEPGVYWLVIQCQHATNNFGLGSTAVSTAFARNSAQTKTTANPNGATLDFVAATWTKVTANYAVRLNGVVFGQTTAF